MNTDYVIGISDKASDALNLLFNTSSGRASLAKRTGLNHEFLGALADLGLRPDRERIFNLGYYTWVEQQGVDVPAFEVRREQSFWDGLMSKVPQWDAMIDAFNTNL